MEHSALVIFSICVQAAIGIMVFAAIAKLINKDGVFKTAAVSAAGLAIVGLLASLFHLGRPLSALNSLAQLGSSWLSREIWLTALFTALTIVIALLVLLKPAAKSAIRVIVPITAVVGLIDVYVMASVYYVTSVPAWQHGATFVESYAAAVSMGALIFLALSLKEAANMRKIAAAITGIAIVFQVVAMMLYYIDLGANGSMAAEQSTLLLSSMSMAMIIKWFFILVGAGLFFFLPGKQQALPGTVTEKAAFETAAAAEAVTGNKAGVIYLSAGLLVIGQFIGRYLFYAVMIVSSVGLN